MTFCMMKNTAARIINFWWIMYDYIHIINKLILISLIINVNNIKGPIKEMLIKNNQINISFKIII